MFRPLIRASALHRPGSASGVMLLEDLHWLDPGSESFLEVFIDALRGTKTLLIANYRLGYTAPWMESADYDQISLAPLPPLEADTLAARLLGDDQSVTPLLRMIADRARGNPLFIEELVRKFEESGYLSGQRGDYRLVRAPELQLVPETVQAIIGARIDNRPETEKSALQAAAVVGREFTLPLLARVVEVPEVELAALLDRLADAGLISQTGAGETTFGFAHPMMQEVAYGSMLSERRRTLHAAVATELEKNPLELDGTRASLIAHHWEEAGNFRQAGSYYWKAATWYGSLNPMAWHGTRDPARALDAWKQVRRLVLPLPLEGQARKWLVWADAQIMNMGLPSQSITSAEARLYYFEALEAARSLGESRYVMVLSLGYAWLQEMSGSAADAVVMLDEVISTLDDRNDSSVKVLLTVTLSHMLRLAGNFPRALQCSDEAMARLHEVADIDKQLFDIPLADFARAVRGRILAMMDRANEARSQLDQVCDSNAPFIRLQAHVGSIDLAWGLNDIGQAGAHLEKMTQLAKSYDNPIWLTVCLGYTGLVQSMRDEYSLAAETLTTALEEMHRRGETKQPRTLTDLAYAQLRMGLNAQARTTAEEAIALAQRRGLKAMHAYAEWVIGGPAAPAFKELVAETGANLLLRLRHPYSDDGLTSDT
jgi:tetratricopeptide (TPR) repeat protein